MIQNSPPRGAGVDVWEPDGMSNADGTGILTSIKTHVRPIRRQHFVPFVFFVHFRSSHRFLVYDDKKKCDEIADARWLCGDDRMIVTVLSLAAAIKPRGREPAMDMIPRNR